MNDTTTAAPAGGTAAPVQAPVSTEPLTLRQATESFLSRRERGETAAPLPDPDPIDVVEQPRTQRAPDGKFAAAQKSEPVEGEDAARPQDATGETQEADPAEKPPLELPRSWSKDRAEHWSKLDRDTQEFLLEHDKTSSAEVRRSQNEAAEIRKAAEAERTAATQARTQYESAAQNALQILQADQARDFGDIKTMADVQRLSTEDPFRYSQWDARQKMIEYQHREVQALNHQREQEDAEQFKSWSKEQDDKFSKQFGEFNDPEKGPKVRASVQSYLTKEVGVPDDVLPKLWSNPLFRDAMFQRVIYDASRFHAAQQAAKAAVQVPKPQVQRPGTVSSKAERGQADIGALQAKLSASTNLREQLAIGAAITAAKRAARH